MGQADIDTLSERELQTGFDAFLAAARRLEQRYDELKQRAAAVDLELQRRNAELATALRAGDAAGIAAASDKLDLDGKRIINAQAEIGARTNRVEYSLTAATDAHLRLTSSLSELENTDMVKATVDLQLQEVAYQAALGATSRVIQPSLLDFLR